MKIGAEAFPGYHEHLRNGRNAAGGIAEIFREHSGSQREGKVRFSDRLYEQRSTKSFGMERCGDYLFLTFIPPKYYFSLPDPLLFIGWKKATAVSDRLCGFRS